MKVYQKIFDPTDLIHSVKSASKHLIEDGLTTMPIYKGKKYSVKDVVNKDGTVNIKKAKKIMEEVADYFGGKKMQNRKENPEWHKKDPNTWEHTKLVAKNAWNMPVPEGYTKQDLMIAALGHDFGKMLSGEGHAEVSYNLIKQIFPDATEKQLEAIRKHMDPLEVIEDKLALATKKADMGILPVAEGKTRLYRVQRRGAEFDVHRAANGEAQREYAGTWFTDDPSKGAWYAHNGSRDTKPAGMKFTEWREQLKNAKAPQMELLYVDIPNEELENMRASKVLEGKDFDYEPEDFIVPQNIERTIVDLPWDRTKPYTESVRGYENFILMLNTFRAGGKFLAYRRGGIMIPKHAFGDAFKLADASIERALKKFTGKVATKAVAKKRLALANEDGTVFRLYDKYADGTLKLVGELKVRVDDKCITPTHVDNFSPENTKGVSLYLYDAAMAFHDKPLRSGEKLLEPDRTTAIWQKYFDRQVLEPGTGYHRDIDGNDVQGFDIMLLNQPSRKLTEKIPWHGGTVLKFEDYAENELPEKKVYQWAEDLRNRREELLRMMEDVDPYIEVNKNGGILIPKNGFGGFLDLLGETKKTLAAGLGDFLKVANKKANGNIEKIAAAKEKAIQQKAIQEGWEIADLQDTEVLLDVASKVTPLNIIDQIESLGTSVKADYKKASILSPQGIELGKSEIFGKEVHINPDRLLKNGRTEKNKVSTELKIGDALTLQLYQFTKTGPSIINPSRESRKGGYEGSKGELIPVEYIRDLEIDKFKREILGKTAELEGADSNLLAYLSNHGTAGILEKTSETNLDQNISTYSKGFGRLNIGTVFSSLSGDKIKSLLVHETLGHGLENFLALDYKKAFGTLPGLPILKVKEDAIKLASEVRAMMMEAKFFLWKEALKQSGLETISPAQLNEFISKVPDKELKELFLKLNHLGATNTAGDGALVSRAITPNNAATYKKVLGTMLGVSPFVITGVAAANNDSTGIFKRGGILGNAYNEYSGLEDFPTFRHLPDYDTALALDDYLNAYSYKIKYGELDSDLSHKIQRKFNLNKTQLNQTLDDLFNSGLGGSLILDILPQLNNETNTLEASVVFKEGGKFILKALDGLKLIKSIDLGALKHLAMVEVQKAKAPKSLAQEVTTKFLKSLTPKTTLSEEELAKKAEEKLLKKAKIKEDLGKYISNEEALEIKTLVLDPLTLESLLRASVKDYIQPNGENMLLNGTTTIVNSDIVKNLQKADSMYNDEKISLLTKIVTAAYVTDTALPVEFVADLKGILKTNYIGKNGKVSKVSINYSNPEIFNAKKSELLQCFDTIKDKKYNLKKGDILRIKRNGGEKAITTDNKEIMSKARGQFNNDTPEILDYFTDFINKDGFKHLTHSEWNAFKTKGTIPERFKKALYDEKLLNDPVYGKYAKLSQNYLLKLAVLRDALQYQLGQHVSFDTKFAGPELEGRTFNRWWEDVVTHLSVDREKPLGTYFAVDGEKKYGKERVGIPAMDITPRVSKKLLTAELLSLYSERPEVYEQLIDAFTSKNHALNEYLYSVYPNETYKFLDFINKIADINFRKNKATQIHHFNYLTYQTADGLVKSGFNVDKFLNDYSEYRKSIGYLQGFLGLPAWSHTANPTHKIHGAGTELPTSDLGQVLSDVRIGFSKDSASGDRRVKTIKALRQRDGVKNLYDQTMQKIKAKRSKLTDKSKDTTREKTELQIKSIKEDSILRLYKLGRNDKLMESMIKDISSAKYGTKLIPKALWGWLSSLWNNGVKKVAHVINEDGNKPMHKSGYEAYRANNTVIDDGVDALIGLALQTIHNDFSKSPNKYYYDNNVKTSIKKQYNERAKLTKSANAASEAVVGLAASVVPVIGPVITTATSAKDIAYDWAAAIDDPSNSNAAHAAVNHAEDIAKVITPGFKYDDYIAKGLGILGNIDDATSAVGTNIFNWMDSKGKPRKISLSKTDPSSALVSTYVEKPKIATAIKRKKSKKKK